jgi:dethiobiotin synthase
MLFITGTGTGTGKTIVTGAILRALRDMGLNAASMKPVQTGGDWTGSRWHLPDLDLHLLAAGLEVDDDTYHLMCPYPYVPACSPHLAGRLAEHYPDIERIQACAEALLQRYDCLLVEGAGGLMAPLDEDQTMLDLIKALECPVLVAASTGLGTINHSLLTLQALRAAEVPVVGMVFSQVEPVEDPIVDEDNPATVAYLGEVDIHGILQYREETGPYPWEAWAEELCGLDAIVEALQ